MKKIRFFKCKSCNQSQEKWTEYDVKSIDCVTIARGIE